MFKLLRHATNIIKNNLRDIGVGVKRSSHWPTVEKHFLENNPACAACSSKDRLNVHHIKPFHLFPELELDPNNLITLCMGKLECHLRLGHISNYKLYNENVRTDAANALKNPNKFEEIVKNAKIKNIKLQ